MNLRTLALLGGVAASTLLLVGGAQAARYCHWSHKCPQNAPIVVDTGAVQVELIDPALLGLLTDGNIQKKQPPPRPR